MGRTKSAFPWRWFRGAPGGSRDPAHQEPTVAQPQWPPDAARASGISPSRRHPAQTTSEERSTGSSSFSALPGSVQCKPGTKAECVRRRGFRESSCAGSAVHNARSAARRDERVGGIRAAGLRRGAPAGARQAEPCATPAASNAGLKLAVACGSVGRLIRRTGLLPFNLQLVHHLLHVWHPGGDLFCARSLL